MSFEGETDGSKEDGPADLDELLCCFRALGPSMVGMQFFPLFSPRLFDLIGRGRYFYLKRRVVSGVIVLEGVRIAGREPHLLTCHPWPHHRVVSSVAEDVAAEAARQPTGGSETQARELGEEASHDTTLAA